MKFKVGDRVYLKRDYLFDNLSYVVPVGYKGTINSINKHYLGVLLDVHIVGMKPTQKNIIWFFIEGQEDKDITESYLNKI